MKNSPTKIMCKLISTAKYSVPVYAERSRLKQPSVLKKSNELVYAVKCCLKCGFPASRIRDPRDTVHVVFTLCSFCVPTRHVVEELHVPHNDAIDSNGTERM